MSLYIEVLSGPSAAEARPILAISDRGVIRRVLEAIAQMTGEEAHDETPVVSLAARRIERGGVSAGAPVEG